MHDKKPSVALDIYQGAYRLVALSSNSPKVNCELYKNGTSIRKFTYPAYKVYNLAAHFSEVIEGYEEGNPDAGFQTAGDTLLGGCIMPTDQPQFRCTICGRVGTVGRCCGQDTREPLNDLAIAEMSKTREESRE